MLTVAGSVWHFFVGNFPSLAALTAVGGGIFSLVKWFDLRRRELEQQRSNAYSALLNISWGWKDGDPNKPVASGEQIAAIYRLVEFKEFAFVTVTALENAGGNDGWQKNVKPHLDMVASRLRKTSEYRNQAKKMGI